VGKWTRWTACGALLCAACDAEAPQGRPGAGPDTRTVVGLRAVEWRSLGGGVDEVPEDLDRAVVQAQCPDGDGWTLLPGQGEPDGSFVIEGLPDGPCWIRIDRWSGGEEPPRNEYLWTDAATIDLVSARAMRRNVHVPAASTKLVIEASGLEPWQPGVHEIGTVAPNVGFFQYNTADFPGSVDGMPAAGDTQVAALTYDLAQLSGFLLDAEAGDRLSVTQWATRENERGIAYSAPVRGFESAALTLREGETLAVEGTFAALPEATYRVHWAIPSFDALAPALHARAVPFARGFALQAARGNGAAEWLDDTLPTEALVLEDPEVFATDRVVDLGEFPLGAPYGADALFDWYATFFATTLPWPDGTPTDLFLAVAQYGDEFPGPDTPVRPRVGPVRSIRIGGLPADRALRGVGLTPEVAWDPPATGEPTSYEVQVIEPGFEAELGGFWRTAAKLIVPADVTTVRLPEDVLREGGHYALLVRAVASTGQQVRVAPLRHALPHAWAEALTETFQP